MSFKAALTWFSLSISVAACQPAIEAVGTDETGSAVVESDDTISSADEALSACATNNGKAYKNIPADNTYYITVFGGPQDKHSNGTMSCGGKADGKSFYIAGRQRFETPLPNNKGCGGARKVKITGTDAKGATRCVYAVAADYGPAQCVEDAAGKPIIDASPAITQALFGLSRAGWSDKIKVIAVPAPDDVALGTNCIVDSNTQAPPKTAPVTAGTGTSCKSATWGGISMALQECVQSITDKRWYQCTPSGWTVLNQSFAEGSEAALLQGGDAGPCTYTHAL